MIMFMTRDPGGFTEVFAMNTITPAEHNLLAVVNGQNRFDENCDVSADEWDDVRELLDRSGTVAFSDSGRDPETVEAKFAGQYIGFMSVTM